MEENFNGASSSNNLNKEDDESEASSKNVIKIELKISIFKIKEICNIPKNKSRNVLKGLDFKNPGKLFCSEVIGKRKPKSRSQYDVQSGNH